MRHISNIKQSDIEGAGVKGFILCIHAMVEGIRNYTGCDDSPFQLDTRYFSIVTHGGKCYGCAATAAICQINNLDKAGAVGYVRERDENEFNLAFKHRPTLFDNFSNDFIERFESVIDDLRRGKFSNWGIGRLCGVSRETVSAIYEFCFFEKQIPTEDLYIQSYAEHGEENTGGKYSRERVLEKLDNWMRLAGELEARFI